MKYAENKITVVFENGVGDLYIKQRRKPNCFFRRGNWTSKSYIWVSWRLLYFIMCKEHGKPGIQISNCWNLFSQLADHQRAEESILKVIVNDAKNENFTPSPKNTFHKCALLLFNNRSNYYQSLFHGCDVVPWKSVEFFQRYYSTLYKENMITKWMVNVTRVVTHTTHHQKDHIQAWLEECRELCWNNSHPKQSNK